MQYCRMNSLSPSARELFSNNAKAHMFSTICNEHQIQNTCFAVQQCQHERCDASLSLSNAFINSHTCFIATNESFDFYGCIIVQPTVPFSTPYSDSYYVSSFCVRNTHRRKGIGGSLFQFMLKSYYFRSLILTVFCGKSQNEAVNKEVEKRLPKLCALYTRFGFHRYRKDCNFLYFHRCATTQPETNPNSNPPRVSTQRDR